MARGRTGGGGGCARPWGERDVSVALSSSLVRLSSISRVGGSVPAPQPLDRLRLNFLASEPWAACLRVDFVMGNAGEDATNRTKPCGGPPKSTPPSPPNHQRLITATEIGCYCRESKDNVNRKGYSKVIKIVILRTVTAVNVEMEERLERVFESIKLEVTRL